MSTRIAILTAVVAGVLGLAVAAPAQEPATLLLKSGGRLVGDLVDMGGSDFTMNINGRERRVPIGDVAVIAFDGDARNLPSGEVAKTDEGHVLVMRNGRTSTGNLYDIGGTSPLKITFDTENGQRQVSSSDIARIYLARPPKGAIAAERQQVEEDAEPSGGTGQVITVAATQRWTSTGITVRSGQVVALATVGRVQLSGEAGDTAGPAGQEDRYLRRAPIPDILAGALIGRVGNGQPFAIGDQSSVPMPGAGALFLGVNDDVLTDNRGSFRVRVTVRQR
ncbi:MAG: hypothetical protein IMZ67_00680 [Acidobacteria bacterium]|nr:hypothetical protein [Acidobacteriota bacterium]